jgi:hypothetical protein
MKVACSLILCAALVFPSALFPATQTAQDKDAQLVAPAQTAPAQAAPVQAAPTQSAPTPAAEAPVAKEPFAFGLLDATPVKLALSRSMSSATAQLSEKVEFEVVEDVKVHDVIVIPRGGKALGTVTGVQNKRRMGRIGKLLINIDSVRLPTGQRVALRSVKDARGRGHQNAIAGAMITSSIVFPIAAPFFLLIHGHDIVIPKGAEFTSYIDDDIPLDAAKFAAPTTIK